ncbi:MAG TPA: GNAT family N-acetyltransferase [Edaphobacter sp.]
MTNASLPRTLVVRLIAPEDAAAVTELTEQLGYPVSEAEATERIRALLTRAEDQVGFVACLSDEVVGWIEASIVHHLQSAPHALIGGLVVKDGVRNLGVGKRLCSEVEAWSRGKGMALLRVTSRMTREGAHRFYLRDGFRQTKTSAVFEKVLS